MGYGARATGRWQEAGGLGAGLDAIRGGAALDADTGTSFEELVVVEPRSVHADHGEVAPHSVTLEH